MSAVLRRLREIFNDPLLVRTEKGMVATERARALAASLTPAIDAIDIALVGDQAFEPATAQMSFEIAASESVSFMLLPSLIARVRQLAPGVQLRVRIPDLQRARQALEEGEIDLLLSFTRTAPAGLRSSALWQQKLVVIAARAHPLSGALDFEEFLRWPHAGHQLGRGGSSIEDVVDEALHKLGRQRRMGVWLPSAIAVPAVVAQTDLLATIPLGIAARFASLLDLQLLAPPMPLGPVKAGMYWHDRMHQNAPHQWLRQITREVAQEWSATSKRLNLA